MIPALLTPVKLLLRRISFICCACMMLACIGCFDFNIPDQDAVVNIYADRIKNNNIIKLDTLTKYDDTASTLTCLLCFDKAKSIDQNLPAYLLHGNKQIASTITHNGIAEFGKIGRGKYDLELGNPVKYPCINIYNIEVPAATKCNLYLYKITNP